MTEPITRRVFLQRVAFGATAAMLNPAQGAEWLNQEFATRVSALPASSFGRPDWSRRLPAWQQDSKPIADDDIPTTFFDATFTPGQLETAWRTGVLKNGFPYGLVDTHTLGGIPEQQNVTVDPDGNAVLTIKRPTPEKLAEWQSDSSMKELILNGEKNGLVMKLSVAAFCGRLPTDTQSIQAEITAPQRIVTGNPAVGMVGTGWALWTLPDMERLTANLTQMGVSAEEVADISSRVRNANLEEDIGEFSLGEPSLELGYPLWVCVLGGQVMTFMAGRKTRTQRSPRADIMHMLFEPIDVGLAPMLRDWTITGWLSGVERDPQAALRQPLQVKLEIGEPIYDPSRDVMVAPMKFSLNGKLLSPRATMDFPGFENDKAGSTTPNLSLWKIKTRHGDWVTIPRMFVISFCSSTKHPVQGETDHVRFGNMIITRRSQEQTTSGERYSPATLVQ